jgi:hypothetical protein
MITVYSSSLSPLTGVVNKNKGSLQRSLSNPSQDIVDLSSIKPAIQLSFGKDNNHTLRRRTLLAATAAAALFTLAGSEATTPKPETVLPPCDKIITQAGHESFQLTLKEVETLFNAVDGMRPYDADAWKDYPERETGSQYGVAFNNQLEFTKGVKNKQDGVISFEETGLATEQLGWDRTSGRTETSKSQDTWQNPDEISLELAENVQTFLASLYWRNQNTAPLGRVGTLRDGLDVDGDGDLTIKDITKLSKDQKTITSDDFIRAAAKCEP